MFYINIAILILVSLYGILPSIDKLWNNNGPTKIAYGLFFLLLLLIISSSVQYFLANQATHQAEDKAKEESQKQAAQIQQGIDSGNRANTLFLMDAFQKRGVDIDSLRKVIQLYQKNTHNQTTVIDNSNKPGIGLYGDEGIVLFQRENYDYHFEIKLGAKQGNITNANIEMRTIGKRFYDKSFIDFGSISAFYKADLSDREGEGTKITIGTSDSLSDVYFYLHGTYYSVDSHKAINYEELYGYSLIDKTFGIPIKEYYESVEKFISQLHDTK
jgi:hypothetical protein